MYKPIDKLQHSFLDFNQPMGLHMNPDNRWVRLADRIPWDEFEVKYAKLFPSDTGNVARPLRMALGALIIQTKFQFSDRELVEQIAENPYLQYFIGLPGFREEAPFDASTLVLFRKRISADMLMEVNEYLLAHKEDDKDDHTPPSVGKSGDDGTAKEDTNKGTLTLDATFSLSKRCYGMSCITTKLEETQLTSIALSVFVTNLFRIQRRILYALLHLFRFWHDWNRCKSWKLQIDT